MSSAAGVRVTGAKGHCFAFARDLFSGTLVLTARDAARGQAAVRHCRRGRPEPRFHQLDLDDLQSIRALVSSFKILYGDADTTPFHIQAELLPLIKTQVRRVVNVSSMMSLMTLKNCSPELQEKFRSETITEEELVGLMNKFVEDTKKGVHQKEGWPNTAYGVSKIGVTVLSRIQARKLSEQRKGDKILLNACCPGWVRTDMAGPKAPKSPEEGAETPVYLALLPPDAEGPHGQFFVSEKKVSEWYPYE
uniref:Carbonyl reductase [NADPH] 1 n=1 Tax=Microcebus murinus TaxID=30608 RepID=A0A8C5W2R8_MICMU